MLLKTISIALVFVGACIMLSGIIIFFKSLVAFKVQANEKRIFTDRVYTASMIMMVFFLVGYIVIGVFFVNRSALTTVDLVIALVFFFGAVFVYAMVVTVTKMSDTISQKTDEIIKTLVNAVEAKDKYTQGHSVHVANIVELIYEYLPNRLREGIHKKILMCAAILHDIGKIGIPDNILNKPGKLTSNERQSIEQHVIYGKNILEPTSYQHIGEIVCYHHERMDGKGYFEIAAENIPIESRIIAVADTYSALCTDRIYRPGKTHEEAMGIIFEAAGTQLDSEIVKVLNDIPKERLEAL
jgi:HD-GYP domain-containing protein (c-di-GMP phosphodiesterase class II)